MKIAGYDTGIGVCVRVEDPVNLSSEFYIYFWSQRFFHILIPALIRAVKQHIFPRSLPTKTSRSVREFPLELSSPALPARVLVAAGELHWLTLR